MRRVVLTRVLSSIPLLLATTLLSFLLVHWAPGSFLDQLRLHPGIPESVIERLEERYGVDLPWHRQYYSWLLAASRGDFGFSLRFQRPVADLLKESLPRTLLLSAIALGCSVAFGTGLGLVSVRRLNGPWDRIACRSALALASVHPVILAIVALSLAAATGALPLGGGSSLAASSLSSWARGADYLRHLVLPESVLVLVLLPGFFLHARGVMAEVLPAPFIAAGRAQGLCERTLVLRHLLPATLSPLVSYASSSLARALNGAFLVEVVTGWPGMGRLALVALRERDSFLLLGTLAVAGVVLSLGNLVADLLLAKVDPRIRLEEASA
jgi:peptide/nickel transport system permease protein